MRVLLVGATEVRSSDATLLLGKAFGRQGCEVEVLPATTELPWFAAVGAAGGRFDDRGYQVGFSRRLWAVADRFHPDVVFLYGSNWGVLPRTIRRLQRRHGCLVALWEVNHFVFGGVGSAALPLYDQVFALDSYFVPVLRVAGARRVRHLPACADPEEHAPPHLSGDEHEWYGADLCFVGHHSEERAAMIDSLRHLDVRVYGTGWVAGGRLAGDRLRTEPVYGLKKNKVYGASRLSLNVHQPHMVHGENFRVFEVAACGGLSISGLKPDLAGCLEPGSEVAVFEGAGDLRAKVDALLEDPDERHRLAAAGRRRVLAEHTYDHRATSILETLAR